MSRLLGHRPSPAMVVALLALFIAMAGTGYAAVKLPANSVGTKQIKANAIVSSKIKDGSLTAKDFVAGLAVKGAEGPPGLQGLQGPQGAAGAQGAKGDSGPPAVTYLDVVNSGAPLAPAASVSCPLGEIATGGGGISATGTLRDSEPTLDGDGFPVGWHAAAVGTDGTTPTPVTAWAVCVG
jgi:hypothetical protein